MMMMTELSEGDNDDDDDDGDDDDDDKVMCGCDSSRSYSVQELGDRDLLWQKKKISQLWRIVWRNRCSR